jgi:predicted nucleotidyltransferase
MNAIKIKNLKLPVQYIETLGKLMLSAANDSRIDKIILFGSCAKGHITEHSDLDICFLTNVNIDWREQIELMDHDPACFPGCDIVILTPSMYIAGKDKSWGVTYWIIREGIELIGN